MDFQDSQVTPPASWEKFESLTRALFAAIWNDPLAQQNGRSGQAQHGVDVFGYPADGVRRVHGVQCKGKNEIVGSRATIAEFDAELLKAERFKPALAHWTFATTAIDDAVLQEHVRIVSEARVERGAFPVSVIGWKSIVALISRYRTSLAEFYPELSHDMPALLEAVKALPSAEETAQLRQALLAMAPLPPKADAGWVELTFGEVRDLGPALMGRPMGPADVAACPVLPEVSDLIDDLERAGSARLAGLPGAGKSICILQCAVEAHRRGWRVLRLIGGQVSHIDQEPGDRTLRILDDAHLIPSHSLRLLEERASSRLWVLSAHTTLDPKSMLPGTVHLDAKRAVRVISQGLKMDLNATRAAVERVDDRVGPRIGDESIEGRLEQAEIAEYPWQFCFILGGGWRRAKSIASSTRAIGADLVLAAAAIRQLASRDAPCSNAQLSDLLSRAEVQDHGEAEIAALVHLRHLLATDDLRCPHQRLAAVLLGRIADGQDEHGRRAIKRLFETVLADPAMPVAGLSLLLNELAFFESGRWIGLIEPSALESLLARCWTATEALDVRAACSALLSIKRYRPDHHDLIRSQIETISGWLAAALPESCYALGSILNGLRSHDEPLAIELMERTDPTAMAAKVSHAPPGHASEIAYLISQMPTFSNLPWKSAYLGALNRSACLAKMAAWPRDAYLSSAATYCQHFGWVDEAFGLDLVESLMPAIEERLRADPIHAFHELNDIFWHVLRVYDPLHIYVGDRAPTGRMRRIAGRLVSRWSAPSLAASLSTASPREFQSAAGILHVIAKVRPPMYQAIALSIDWDRVATTIGPGWSHEVGDAIQLFGAVYAHQPARAAVRAMIASRETMIETLSTRMAAIAPDTAVRHLEAGRRIALTHWGSADWQLGALLLAHLAAARRPDLIERFLGPHEQGLGKILSQKSPSFYREATFFIRLQHELAPASFERVLAAVDVSSAETGWTDALKTRPQRKEDGGRDDPRAAVRLLVQHGQASVTPAGELARKLRSRFPTLSVPTKKWLQPLGEPPSLD